MSMYVQKHLKFLIISSIILNIVLLISFTISYQRNKNSNNIFSSKNTIIQEEYKDKYILNNKTIEVLRQEKDLMKNTINDLENQKTSFVMIRKDILKNDLNKNYEFLSTNKKEDILNTILQTSETYHINPLILYSLLHTKSNMKFWISHTNKKTKENYVGVGLGEVFWDRYKDILIKDKIVLNESDLFDPIINIQATAYIYNYLSQKPLFAKTTTIDESVLNYYFDNYINEIKIFNDKLNDLIKLSIFKLPIQKEENNEQNTTK